MPAVLRRRSTSAGAMRASGSTSCAAPCAMASRGMPKTTQLASSWQTFQLPLRPRVRSEAANRRIDLRIDRIRTRTLGSGLVEQLEAGDPISQAAIQELLSAGCVTDRNEACSLEFDDCCLRLSP